MSPENTSPRESRAAAALAKAEESGVENHQPQDQTLAGSARAARREGTKPGKAGRSAPAASSGQGDANPPHKPEAPEEAAGAEAEVGVLHSSVEADLWWAEQPWGDPGCLGQPEPATRRGGTCHHATQRSEGGGDGPQGILTPAKLRALQSALYRQAKAEPKWRFWFLKLCDEPVTRRAEYGKSVRSVR